MAEDGFMGSKTLTKIKIHPTGMRLHEWICLEEGFFEQYGLDVEVLKSRSGPARIERLHIH